MADERDSMPIIHGTCQAMCSTPELQERQKCMEINLLEAEPGTEHMRHPRGSPALAVKRYSRPAAGRALPLPEAIRPIAVLERTTDHLISLAGNPFSGTYAFIADRLRAVVQDLVIQHLNDERAAGIYERIIRYHALAAVKYADARDAVPSYSSYHNHELLSKALVSLMHIYAQLRHTDASAAETRARAEFHGYHLLLHAGDALLSLSHASALSSALHRSPPIRVALLLLDAMSSRDGWCALRLLRTLPPSALGCALHLLPSAREYALGALRRAYLKTEPLPAQWVCELLLLPADSEVLRAAIGRHGFALADAQLQAGGTDAGQRDLDRLCLQPMPPADTSLPAQKEVADPLALLSLRTADLADGAKLSELVSTKSSLWPLQSVPAEESPQPGASTCAEQPAEAGDHELLEMMNTLRLQINARPDFMQRASESRPWLTAAEAPTAGFVLADDDELALALASAISGMSAALPPRADA